MAADNEGRSLVWTVCVDTASITPIAEAIPGANDTAEQHNRSVASAPLHVKQMGCLLCLARVFGSIFQPMRRSLIGPCCGRELWDPGRRLGLRDRYRFFCRACLASSIRYATFGANISLEPAPQRGAAQRLACNCCLSARITWQDETNLESARVRLFLRLAPSADCLCPVR